MLKEQERNALDGKKNPESASSATGLIGAAPATKEQSQAPAADHGWDRTHVALFITGLFLYFTYTGIVNHEMWRDEYRSFVIAQTCKSIFDVGSAFRLEGLPSIWNYCLFAITRFTDDSFYMQLFHVVTASAAVYLVARYSPFRLWQKVLISFGYFPFYEYAVISRPYSLGVLFLFAYCTLHCHSRGSAGVSDSPPPGRAAINSSKLPINNLKVASKTLRFLSLLLLANTSVYGAILAFALCAGVLAETYLDRRDVFSAAQKRGIAYGALAVVCFTAVVAAVVLLSPEGFKGDWDPDKANVVWRYCRTGVLVMVAYLPIPWLTTGQFWSTSLFCIFKPWPYYWIVSLSLFAVFLLSMANKRLPFVTYLLGTSAMVGLTLFFFTGDIRHYGHLFLLLIACRWLAVDAPESTLEKASDRKILSSAKVLANCLFAVLLVIHLLIGIYAYRMDLQYTFAPYQEAVQFLKEKKLDNEFIAVDKHYLDTGFSYLLKRPIYSTHRQAASMCAPWREREVFPQFGVMLGRAADISAKIGRPVYLFSGDEPTCLPEHKPPPGVRVVLLKTFGYCLVHFDRLYLFEVSRDPNAPRDVIGRKKGFPDGSL